MSIENTKVQIRYATSQDNILLAQIGAETFSDTFGADNTPEDLELHLSNSFSPERQAQELALPDSIFLIAEENGEVAGFAWLLDNKTDEGVRGEHPIEISRIYARKKWIGQGVGASLMQACLIEAEKRKCDVIWLGVWERNPRAIRFYQKWGFETVGTHIFQVGNDPQTDFIMQRSVRK